MVPVGTLAVVEQEVRGTVLLGMVLAVWCLEEGT